MGRERRVQLQIPIPYNREPRQVESVRSYLDRGYRIVHYQRLSDSEVVVTLEEGELAQPSA
jgi:hypothetical protein